MQEVSVCRKATVVCGHLDTDWDDFSGALFAVTLPGDAVNGPWSETRYAISEQRKELDKEATTPSLAASCLPPRQSDYQSLGQNICPA